MKAKILIFGILFLIAFSINCRKERHSCATCSDEVTWNSYGDWTLQSEGENGFSGGDNPVNLISYCGWEVLMDTIISGVNIYPVSSCDNGVLFVWINGSFSVFQVQQGWTGSTKEGIKLGDNLSKFLEIYPYFEYFEFNPPPDTNFIYLEYENDAEGRFVGATFTKDEKLIRLYVNALSFKSEKGAKGEFFGLIFSENKKLVPYSVNKY